MLTIEKLSQPCKFFRKTIKCIFVYFNNFCSYCMTKIHYGFIHDNLFVWQIGNKLKYLDVIILSTSIRQGFLICQKEEDRIDYWWIYNCLIFLTACIENIWWLIKIKDNVGTYLLRYTCYTNTLHSNIISTTFVNTRQIQQNQDLQIDFERAKLGPLRGFLVFSFGDWL